MPNTNIDVSILLKARDEASGVLKKMGGQFRGSAQDMAKSFAIIGAAAAAALGLAVKSAAAFETRLTNVATLISGDSTEAVNGLKKGILELTKVIPKSADELGAAAYQIVSAGISDTTEALKVLEASGRLATAGLGTTEEATDLLTSALNAFQIPAKDSEKTADILFKTVKAGKTTVSELAQAFGMVAPIAAAAGVSLEEMQAATAALTTSGLKTSVAQTQVRQTIVSMIKPTKEMKGLLTAIGAETSDVAIKQDGLVGTLVKLKEATKGDNEELAKAFGSVEALNAVLALTGPQANAFTESLKSMTDGTVAMDDAFNKQTETFDSNLQLMKNGVERLKIAIGGPLLGSIGDVMKAFTPMADAFAKFAEKNPKLIATILILVAALGAIAAAFMAIGFILPGLTAAVSFFGVAIGFLTGPIGLVILAIGLLIGAGILLVKNWDKVMAQARQTADFIVNIFNWMFQSQKEAFERSFNNIKQGFQDTINFVRGIIDKIRDLVEGFRPSFKIGLDLPDIVGAWNSLRQRAHNIGIPGFQTGGVVPGIPGEPRLAMLHGGEKVLPHGAGGEGSGGGGLVININAGTVIASRTEIREFAEKIYEAVGELARAQNKTPVELLRLDQS